MERRDGDGVNLVAHGFISSLVDQDLACCRCATQPRRQIHIRANHGVIHHLRRADVANDHLAGANANANGDRWQTAFHPFRHQFRMTRLHCLGGLYAQQGVIGTRQRCAEKRYHFIADKFIHRAARFANNRRHCGQMFVQHRHHHIGGQLLGNAGKATHIRK